MSHWKQKKMSKIKGLRSRSISEYWELRMRPFMHTSRKRMATLNHISGDSRKIAYTQGNLPALMPSGNTGNGQFPIIIQRDRIPDWII